MDHSSLPTKAQLASIDWYRQAGAVKTLYVWYPLMACVTPTIRGAVIGPHYRDSYLWIADDYMTVYFNKAGFREVLDHYLAREATEPGFFAALHQDWLDGSYRPLTAHSAKPLPSNAPLDELLAEFRAVSQPYQHAWKEAIFLDVFDVFGESFIQETLGGQPIDQLDRFIVNPSQSPYQVERQQLLALAEELTTLPTQPASFEALERSHPKLAAKLEAHAERFHWIQNDYKAFRRLKSVDFFDRLRALVTNPALRESEATLLAAIGHEPVGFTELPLPAQTRCRLVGLISLWRDERKALTQQVNARIADLARLIANETGSDLAVLEHLRWGDLERFIHGQRDLAEVAKRRMAGALYAIVDQQPHEWFGAEGHAIAELLNRIVTDANRRALTGRPAFAGRVVGIARIVMGQDNFAKFRDGEILIAPNTRPEYLPIMRHAKAVVTEEGGLTSHAAIVARELSVPTIVGVQGVITALADGDQIEVDANEGIVRKIS